MPRKVLERFRTGLFHTEVVVKQSDVETAKERYNNLKILHKIRINNDE